MRPDPLAKLKAAAAADAQLVSKDERRARRRELWAAWVAFWKTVARYVKVATTIAVGVSTLYGFIRSLPLLRARDVGPALPPATGAPSTAADFISKPPHEDPKR